MNKGFQVPVLFCYVQYITKLRYVCSTNPPPHLPRPPPPPTPRHTTQGLKFFAGRGQDKPGGQYSVSQTVQYISSILNLSAERLLPFKGIYPSPIISLAEAGICILGRIVMMNQQINPSSLFQFSSKTMNAKGLKVCVILSLYAYAELLQTLSW